MANRAFTNSRLYTGHVMPVLIDGNCVIGASGAVGTTKGPFVKSVTHLGTGLYQINLTDTFNRYYGGSVSFVSPATGGTIDPATGTVGHAYIIQSVGNTDWKTAGVPAGITPAPNMAFVLASAPAAGTGTVKAIGHSGVFTSEALGDTNLTLNPSAPQNPGAIILFQCLDATGAPVNPAAGSVMAFTCYLSNSSIQINGE